MNFNNFNPQLNHSDNDYIFNVQQSNIGRDLENTSFDEFVIFIILSLCVAETFYYFFQHGQKWHTMVSKAIVQLTPTSYAGTICDNEASNWCTSIIITSNTRTYYGTLCVYIFPLVLFFKYYCCYYCTKAIFYYFVFYSCCSLSWCPLNKRSLLYTKKEIIVIWKFGKKIRNSMLSYSL